MQPSPISNVASYNAASLNTVSAFGGLNSEGLQVAPGPTQQVMAGARGVPPALSNPVTPVPVQSGPVGGATSSSAQGLTSSGACSGASRTAAVSSNSSSVFSSSAGVTDHDVMGLIVAQQLTEPVGGEGDTGCGGSSAYLMFCSCREACKLLCECLDWTCSPVGKCLEGSCNSCGKCADGTCEACGKCCECMALCCAICAH